MKKFTMLLAALALFAFLAFPMGMRGQEVTLNFATNECWEFPTSYTVDPAEFTCGDYTITLAGSSGNGYKYNTGYLINGKLGAYLQLPAFAFDVEKIEVVGRAGASGGVKQNIYVGDVAVSTETTGATGTNTYMIAAAYQAAGNIYTLKVNSNHNTQITEIKVYALSSNPTINAADVSIDYDTTEGAIEYTINNPAEDGVLSAETEAEWLTLSTVGETVVPFTCTVNDDGERVATVTLTYTYDTDQTVTKSVTVTQANNPNAPGTENNPYTVAQARAAIDAGTGTQGVYATGIVSAIPTAYNSTYGNVTFNMVDEEGDEEFLQAYRCGGDEAANVAVGDVVVVYGNLTYHIASGTYEFAQGCQVVSLTHPAVPTINIATNTLNVDAEAHEGTINVTYANVDIEMAEVVLCNADGETTEYDWIQSYLNDEHQVWYSISANEGEARTAYLKVCILDETTLEPTFCSSIVTVNQAAYVVDYATLPFEFNGGKADIENTNGLTQEGLGNDYNSTNYPTTQLKFDNTGDWLLLHFIEAPSTLKFNIKGNSFNGGTFTVLTSEDGETYENLVTYDDFGTSGNELKENETFSLGEDVRYIKWIYTNKGQGNVGLGNIYLYEFGGGPAPVASITVDPATVNAPAEGAEGTLAITYQNIPDLMSFDYYFCDANGDELEDTDPNYPNWIYAEINEEEGVYTVSYTIDANEGEARTAYFKVYTPEAEGVYAIVTVNQAAYVPPVVGQQFALFGGNLVEGDYIIYYNGKAMNNVVSSGRLQYAEIEPEDNVITTDNAAIVWHIALNDEGYWTIYSADANAYAASTGVKNKAQMLEDGTDDMAMWTVTEISGTYEFVNKANAAGDINANLRNNGTYGFACYSASTGGALSLYKYTEQTVATYTKEIVGYGTSTNGGYYLIASPVVAVTPTADNGFLTDAYDLYYFDQAVTGGEWINYQLENNGINFFNIATGKGYLYASQENTTLTFTGAPYEGDGVVTLSKTDDVAWSGWNLIGNPFGEEAYFGQNFYRMNENGSEIVAVSGGVMVAPMEGIFVLAKEDGDEVEFGIVGSIPGPIDDPQKLVLNLNHNQDAFIDRAIIRFDESNQLPKFQLNPNSTKICFTLDETDFAVVRSDAQGEMPVSFKAAENGTYTLSVNVENMDVDYLHLIDNMTGMDIDLLQTPSYSFEANTTDYTTRFRLVFSTSTSIGENNDSFAFFSNGRFIVSNEGQATLQVIDVTGRIVSDEIINGTCSVSVDTTPGVYMLRLVSGNNVKIQKVVVK